MSCHIVNTCRQDNTDHMHKDNASNQNIHQIILIPILNILMMLHVVVL